MRIEVRLDGKIFVRFGLFDAFFHRKVWRRPALFAAILGIAAAFCFVLHQRRGAVLLGSVLVLVAAGLPAAYFLSFFLSLRVQARAQGLGEGKYVYTLELGGKGVGVDNGRERAEYPWSEVYRVYCRPQAAYLYVTPQRAFLIPYRCVKGGGDKLRELLGRFLPGQA